MGESKKEVGRDTGGVQKRSHSKPSAWQIEQHENHVQTITALTNQLAHNQEQQDRSDRAKAFRERVTIALVLGTVIATVVSDWIFYRTMGEARDAAETAHNAGEDALESTLMVSGLQIAEARTAAAQSLREARSANGISLAGVTEANRGWISVAGVDMQPMQLANRNGVGLGINITVNNNGRDPVFNVRRFQEHFVVPTGVGLGGTWEVSSLKIPPNNTCKKTRSDADIGTIWPGIAAHSTAPVGDIFSPPRSVADQTSVIGVHGCFIYETLRTTHRSAFCILGVPHGQGQSYSWATCPGRKQNFAD